MRCKAIPIVQRTQNRFEESCCHGLMGLEFGLQGHFSESLAEFDKALRVAADGKEFSIACWDLIWKTEILFLMADWKAANEVLEEGNRIADRIENTWAEHGFAF